MTVQGRVGRDGRGRIRQAGFEIYPDVPDYGNAPTHPGAFLFDCRELGTPGGRAVSRWDTSWHSQVKVKRQTEETLERAKRKMGRGEPLTMAEQFCYLEESKRMKLSEVFPDDPAFLKAADLQGKTPRVTIASIGVREFDGEAKLTLGFQNTQRGMVVNKTNRKILQAAFGDETDAWIGKVIMLHTVQTNMGPGIGVVVPSGNGQPQQQPGVTTQLATPQQAPPADPDLQVPPGDDIPF